MAYSGSYGGSSHSCRSYCNISGYHRDGFSCGSLFCCGSVNVRYCCSNSSLDISSAYSEKCRCPMSSCSYLSWDILLPCIAAALFVLLMLTICCCHGCRQCIKCRQYIRRQCFHSNPATPSSNGSDRSPATLEEGQRTGDGSAFSHLPPYEFGPPKYESLELAEAPPKYEDIMAHGQPEGHVNSAFLGDSISPNYTVMPDCNVTPDYRVTADSVSPDIIATADYQSSGTLVLGTSGRVQGESDNRTSSESLNVINSQATDLRNSDRPYERFQMNQLSESSSNQSPPSLVLRQNAGAGVSTNPRQVASQEESTSEQVSGTSVDVNPEILQVVEQTPGEERTQEQTTV